MITECYSVYDGAVKAFLPPFFCRSRGEALRSFTEAVNSSEHQFHKHAGDYTLFFCGKYDDNSGLFVAGEHLPERVVGAVEVMMDDPVFPPNKRLAM